MQLVSTESQDIKDRPKIAEARCEMLEISRADDLMVTSPCLALM